MPILGIIDSAKTGRISTNSYSSIATVTVGAGGAANVEFTSIPSTYTHLQVRATLRSNRSATDDSILWRVNADSGSNYTIHSLIGNGSAASADAGASLTYGYYFNPPAASATADIFGVGIIDILDYADTNKFKTFRTLHGSDRNGAGNIQLTSSLWRSTSAITSIKFESQNAANISQYSSFALFGIKGA
jgi:hypothetical protein